MSPGRAVGAGLALALSFGAALSAGWLATPEETRIALGLAEAPPPAPAAPGWGAPAATAEPAPAPVVDLSALDWMAWTPETGAFFLAILAALSLMTGIEILSPGGAPRRGLLGITTTRGDRLFITLLGAAWILLGWLGTMGAPLWGGLAIAAAWGVVVFWKG